MLWSTERVSSIYAKGIRLIRQYKPIPPEMVLAPTLAQRVNQFREWRNLTVRDVARLTRFTMNRVEDIEGGLETWLSSTDRQLLAKALSVEPYLLQEVERKSNLEPDAAQRRNLLLIGDAIQNGARELECPNCGGTLKCSMVEGFDMKGNPISFPKAFCLKCPFILK